LGLLGLGLVFSPSQAHLGWLPLGAAAISGLGAAGVTFITKQISYGTTQTTVALWITSVIANIFMAIVLREAHPAVGWHIQWFYLLAFGIVSIIASWSLIKGLKLVDAGAAAIIGLLEIVFGVVFGVILFHERPGMIVLFGVLVIVAASAIPYMKDLRIKRRSLDMKKSS
jgi:drug/metabolite transporter (DMT)-like permease